MNPSYDKICSTLKKFDDQWLSYFKEALNSRPDKERILDSLNSLVALRNKEAHGHSSGPAFKDVKEQFYDAILIVEILDEIVRI